MKTVDFNKKFLDIKRKEIIGDTMGELIAASLYNGGSDNYPVLPEQKFMAYKICTKLVANNGIIEVSEEEGKFLKEFCSKCFFAGAYGQIVELL